MRFMMTRGVLALALASFGGSACSLDGLTFDLPGGGGGAADPGEDCQNGVDDDSNGAVDCDDDGCAAQGYACIEIPPGWSGPVVLYRGAPGGAQSCPDAFPSVDYQGGTDLQADPASCAPCACSAPGAGCHGHGFTPYGNATCDQEIPHDHTGVSNGSCGAVTAANVQSFVINQPTVEIDGCVPSGGEPTLPPPVWPAAAVLCGGAEPTACNGSGTLCAPPSPAPFQSGVCVWQPGDVICPGGYPERHRVGHEGDFTDTRGCTECTCPQQFSCSPIYNYYSDDACAALIMSVQEYETCVPTPGLIPSVGSYNLSGGSISGSCPPTGGEPQGGVVQNNPTTVCCRP